MRSAMPSDFTEVPMPPGTLGAPSDWVGGSSGIMSPRHGSFDESDTVIPGSCFAWRLDRVLRFEQDDFFTVGFTGGLNGIEWCGTPQVNVGGGQVGTDAFSRQRRILGEDPLIAFHELANPGRA